MRVALKIITLPHVNHESIKFIFIQFYKVLEISNIYRFWIIVLNQISNGYDEIKTAITENYWKSQVLVDYWKKNFEDSISG